MRSAAVVVAISVLASPSTATDHYYTTAYGPAGPGVACTFPFTYQGTIYSSCTGTDTAAPVVDTQTGTALTLPNGWCATSGYDENKLDSVGWGMCGGCPSGKAPELGVFPPQCQHSCFSDCATCDQNLCEVNTTAMDNARWKSIWADTFLINEGKWCGNAGSLQISHTTGSTQATCQQACVDDVDCWSFDFQGTGCWLWKTPPNSGTVLQTMSDASNGVCGLKQNALHPPCGASGRVCTSCDFTGSSPKVLQRSNPHPLRAVGSCGPTSWWGDGSTVNVLPRDAEDQQVVGSVASLGAIKTQTVWRQYAVSPTDGTEQYFKVTCVVAKEVACGPGVPSRCTSKKAAQCQKVESGCYIISSGTSADITANVACTTEHTGCKPDGYEAMNGKWCDSIVKVA
jgi:hypothetical protein